MRKLLATLAAVLTIGAAAPAVAHAENAAANQYPDLSSTPTVTLGQPSATDGEPDLPTTGSDLIPLAVAAAIIAAGGYALYRVTTRA